MILKNENDHITAFISGFTELPEIMIILDNLLEKEINQYTREELENFIKSLSPDKLDIWSPMYDRETFLDKIKLISYTEVLNESTGERVIKINDKENLLTPSINLFVYEYDFNDPSYLFLPDKIRETHNIKRTASGYFNIKLNGDNLRFDIDDNNTFVIFYQEKKNEVKEEVTTTETKVEEGAEE